MQLKLSFLKRCRLLTACTVFFASLVVTAQEKQRGKNFPKPLLDENQGYAHIERFINVMEQVRANHPDAEKLSYERLINFALEGMVGSLDRFSGYYHPESRKIILDEEALPSYRTLGFSISKDSDGFKIEAVHLNSSASEANINSGDYLLKIDGISVKNSTFKDLESMLLRPAGYVTKLTLLNKEDHKEYETALTHRVVFTDGISHKELLKSYDAPSTGYIALEQFTASSHRELVNALDQLEDDGMKELILDVRENPGGLLNQAVLILGEFLPANTEVVTTQGRSPANEAPPLKTQKKKRRERDYPLVLLIDKNSASASELIAGVFQDLKRATIVGETSFGKGSVQNIRQVGGGGSLKMTIATYHTPSGRTPHKVGITPDIECEITDSARNKAKLLRYASRLSPAERKKTKGWKDPVILKALESFKK